MKVRVFIQRRNGSRTKERGAEGLAGEIRMQTVMVAGESVTSVHLARRTSMSCWDQDVVPALYEPRLVAIGHDSLLLRGYEAAADGSHVQEWYCVIAGQAGSSSGPVDSQESGPRSEYPPAN